MCIYMYKTEKEEISGMKADHTGSCKHIDIRTVSAETLTDINDVVIDINLPPEKRKEQFVKQIGNPCCFRVGKIIVQLEYKNTGPSVSECFAEYAECSSNLNFIQSGEWFL